jgi:hypothetical protein
MLWVYIIFVELHIFTHYIENWTLLYIGFMRIKINKRKEKINR